MTDTTTSARAARCTYFRSCGSETTSAVARTDRAFFMDKSAPQDGCAAAGTNARGQCGYAKAAHDLVRAEPQRKYLARLLEHDFTPQVEGEPYDEYYCGCRGWD